MRKSIADSFVRVNVKVLDKIMNIVGELVLNRNQIVQYSNQSGNHEFTKLSQQLNIITSELQSEVMSTRMQPIGSILTKFERLVRDFSRQNDKKISLKLSGQETELDKTLIEAIKDPLVHIIRNACDHGMETIDEREVSGKSPDGTIHIKAYNESGQVTVEIVDDGRGLNKDKIGAQAIEKGVITQERFEKMTDAQIYNLIFAPGFS
ncbi:MAG: chemotaxis protein CheA, partial [Bdellovibrionales bacterium]